MMTDTELTILSLVAEGPRFGYEIQQVIDERGLREWLAIGFSSVDYLLNRLEEQGLLSSQLRPNGPGPARKVYTVTTGGAGVLQTAIVERLRQPRGLGTGIELGLANLNAITPRQVFQALSQHERDLSRQRAAVEKTWQQHQENEATAPDHIRALYTHSLTIMQTELDWLRAFLADWQIRYPAVTGAESDDTTAVHRHTDEMDPARLLQRLPRPPGSTEG